MAKVCRSWTSISKLGRWLASIAMAAGGLAHAGDVTPGFEAGLRFAYGNPMGTIEGTASSDLSALFSGQIPVQLDLGYRVTPELAVAIFGQYAFTSVAAWQCGRPGVSCSASDVRAGVEVLWHFLPGRPLDPWAGFGAGYEWATAAQAGTSEVTLRGFEYCNLQLGADYSVTPRWSVGPFAQLTLGRYAVATVVQGATWSSSDVAVQTTHEWLQFGVRGSLSL